MIKNGRHPLQVCICFHCFGHGHGRGRGRGRGRRRRGRRRCRFKKVLISQCLVRILAPSHIIVKRLLCGPSSCPRSQAISWEQDSHRS